MKQQIQALENEMNAELKRLIPIDGSSLKPVPDGAVNLDQYCSVTTAPRILWILMETWSQTPGEIDGGWSLTEKIRGWIKKGEFTKRDTFGLVAHIVYAVYNGYPNANEIPDAKDDPKVFESLNKIAIINVKKFPARESRNDQAETIKYYKRDKHFLIKQIRGYKPDIIICGIGRDTTPLLLKDLGLTRGEFKPDQRTAWSCKMKDGCLFVWAYHPSYVLQGGGGNVDFDKYVNDIVTEIKNNWHRSLKTSGEP